MTQLTGNTPHGDPIEEGRRVIEEAQRRDLTVKLIGGTAIREHTDVMTEEPFDREYRDVDFVSTREDKKDVIEMMVDLGYNERERVNKMQRYRLEFHDPENDRKADYVIDTFQFSHEWPLRDRVEVDHPTVPIEDLLLSKLQIFEISDRDVRDVIAMLSEHSVEGSDDNERIDPGYIAGRCSTDWGLYKTTTTNLDRTERYLEGNEFPIDEDTVSNRIQRLRREIQERPKSIKWKLRSVIGERKRWYKRPELT